jgi:sugar-specific transcriptional regulator TrmB
MLSQLLKSQGLTAKEINIFAYLVEMGEQPASIIAKRAKLSRSTCYAGLDSLMAKGFIAQISRRGSTFFAANDLAVLLDQIKNQKTTEINQILRLKKDLYRNTSVNSLEIGKSRAHYFSGEEGIATLIQQTLSRQPVHLRICLSKQSFMHEKLGSLLHQSTAALKILTASPHSVLPTQAISKHLPAIFDLGIDVITTSNQVVIICLPEQFGLLIDSNMIATAQSRLFDFVWKISKPIFKLNGSKSGPHAR